MHGTYKIKIPRLKTRGQVVVWSTALQAGRSQPRFFIDTVLSAALWPRKRLSFEQK